ncbi:hypothetical protein BTA51_05190 [Hahella sp. CCB-MM4]|nr:hypothetical protein BTA51_05190 [Hahella sp. CCB-MM4]
MSVLNELSPSNQTASVVHTAAEEVSAVNAHVDLLNLESTQTPSLDPASSLLSNDFGAGDLSPYAQDSLPEIDASMAVASQAQQWVQYILSAWL